ncbi:amidohydrolase [Amycolatopsis anabasis]|uniref:amidohydrolase n=1 Tax=Amycolatopsis anabasis TaxID=1840409 RepID=UPI00131E762B|nr:amidohydrolase [Amycolatopsis anabasis]
MDIDTVLRNGKVVTVDREFSVVDAFAVRGDRIVALGTDAEMAALIGPGTRVIDLAGRMVLPGFVDAHPHTIHRALQNLAQPSLAGAESVAEVARRIGERAANAEPGAWIWTTPLGDPPDYVGLPDRFSERRWPTRADLDAVAPDNPVYIPTSAYWPHPAIFNSAALRLLGVTERTPDEPNVRIAREPGTGTPTGVVHGLNIFNRSSRLFGALQSLLPTPPDATVRKAIADAFRENATVGVTACYEAHGNFFLPVLHELAAAGALANRVVGAHEVPARQPLEAIGEWMAALTDATGAGTGDDRMRTIGATVTLDGPPQFGLSLMHSPYRNPQGEPGNGYSAVSTEKLADIARLAVRHDLRLNIVAAGDQACAMTVRALESVHRETSLADRRWVVQHFPYPTREQIASLKEMGLVAQTYTSVDFSRGEEIYVDRMGGDGWRSLVPLRWWLDAGVPVALSSDGGHYDPLFQLWTALRRTDGRTGRSLLTPAKTVTREEAIATYTINGAVVMGAEDRIGSLEVGKLADFVVLDRDILRCPVDEIRETRTVLTAIGGRIVHDPGSLATETSAKHRPR